MLKKIVIVGSNHAGLSLTKCLLERETKYEIILIDKKSVVSYLGCGLSLLLKKEVSDMSSLFYVDMQQLKSKVSNLYINMIIYFIKIMINWCWLLVLVNLHWIYQEMN